MIGDNDADYNDADYNDIDYDLHMTLIVHPKQYHFFSSSCP